MGVRNLVLVLGDQLDFGSSAFDAFDPACDCVWMAEAAEESTHVPSHKARIALFLSAMRHFARDIESRNWPLHYRRIDDSESEGTLAAGLDHAIHRLRPERIVLTQPGDWRVQQSLMESARRHGLPIEIREDRHFYCPLPWFRRYAAGRKQLRLEFFYREMRKMHGVLMSDAQPEGGQWNFDAANRGSFGAAGPGVTPKPQPFAPDAITSDVIRLVAERFAGHPGSLDDFDFPVTAAQAQTALADFIDHRLPDFGQYQDAMWTGEPYLYHSRLSAALNLKLISPRLVVEAALDAYRRGAAPLAAVEGFIRQIIGWREYVRGIYWTSMPDYADSNALSADAELPAFYWTGDTPMHCLREAIGQTLRFGYAHHIQRLMVTGLYALLLGVRPSEIHQWYLAIYVDAVEWVELPNVIGMSQFADGGKMASKPYAATGKYIQRMSNYCRTCPFDPAQAAGDSACPFTTLYWDFLARNEDTLRAVPRMELQLRNLARMKPAQLALIRQQAGRLRSGAQPQPCQS